VAHDLRNPLTSVSHTPVESTLDAALYDSPLAWIIHEIAA
jgi:hypothetical protein